MLEAVEFWGIRERLISRPKPPVRARIIERENGRITRAATVLYDGEDLWYIDDGTRIELNSTGRFAVLVEGGEVIRRDGNVAANNWAKQMLAGHLISGLDAPPSPNLEWPRARGNVAGVEIANAYECWIIDVDGLKADQEVQFRLWVEPSAGFVIRLRRQDLDVSVDAEELVIGRLA